MGSSGRIVGLADFTPHHPEAAELAQINQVLMDHTKRVLPGLEWTSKRDTYVCFRPMSPDGLPVVPRLAPQSSVWVNCGHGPSGWTTCAGTGEMLADAIMGGEKEEQ